jgi:hypothetical protein
MTVVKPLMEPPTPVALATVGWRSTTIEVV